MALWSNWNSEKHYGDLLFKRATGESEEMNSSKAIAKIMREFYRPGMKILDVGCGAGHYLVSLRKMVDEKIDYTGVDPTPYYLDLARKAFGDSAKFIAGDIFNLPFEEKSYDIVICNHVILHLPPENISKAFSELIRVSKRKSITRTVFGERNYIIKEVLTHNDLEPDQPKTIKYDHFDLTRQNFRYFNMYTADFIRQLILANNNVIIEIRDDNDFLPFDNTGKAKISTATKTVGKMQVSGNLILDYKFIITDKK
jgi:ubiquinone/menaquinone biosynthesis C-methylase UbiE